MSGERRSADTGTLGELRQGRDVHHALTFLMGVLEAAGRRGLFFASRGVGWEIVEVYEDGTLAARPVDDTRVDGYRLFQTRELIHPQPAPCLGVSDRLPADADLEVRSSTACTYRDPAGTT